MTTLTQIVDIDTDEPLDELANDYTQKYRDKHPTAVTSVLYRAMVRRFGIHPTEHAIKKAHKQAKSRRAIAMDSARHFHKGK